MEQFKKTILLGTFWSFIGQFGYVLVVLLSNVFFSRLLTPFEYGQIGIAMFFIIIFNVLVEAGLSGALIRKMEAKAEDYSTILIFNVVLSVFIFLLVCFFSGFIARFYNNSQLKNILIISSVIVIVNAFQIAHIIKLTRDFRFKEKAFFQLVSISVASVIGIGAAYMGMGVWSMIITQILNSVIFTAILWKSEKVITTLVFCKKSFKDLMSFGINTTISSLINTSFENIYQLVLGKYFSVVQVGFFYQAKRLTDMPFSMTMITASGPIYSSISKIKEDKELFNRSFLNIFKIINLILAFICFISFVYAESIMLFLYGSKWLNAAFYMKILSLSTLFISGEAINQLVFKVYNKTAFILKIMVVKNVIQLITIVLGVYYLDLNILIFGFLSAAFISSFIYYYYSRKLICRINRVEIVNFFKILSIIVFLFLIHLSVKEYLGIGPIFDFLMIPFELMFYMSTIQLLKIFDIKGEVYKFIGRGQ